MITTLWHLISIIWHLLTSAFFWLSVITLIVAWLFIDSYAKNVKQHEKILSGIEAEENIQKLIGTIPTVIWGDFNHVLLGTTCYGVKDVWKKNDAGEDIKTWEYYEKEVHEILSETIKRRPNQILASIAIKLEEIENQCSQEVTKYARSYCWQSKLPYQDWMKSEQEQGWLSSSEDVKYSLIEVQAGLTKFNEIGQKIINDRSLLGILKNFLVPTTIAVAGVVSLSSGNLMQGAKGLTFAAQSLFSSLDTNKSYQEQFYNVIEDLNKSSEVLLSKIAERLNSKLDDEFSALEHKIENYEKIIRPSEK